MEVTYQVTDTVEPSHQLAPLVGEVIFGDQTSLFARCTGFGTGAADTPRAKKRRAAENLVGNIIMIVVVVVVVVVDGLKNTTYEGRGV
jgi:hypothetical protein